MHMASQSVWAHLQEDASPLCMHEAYVDSHGSRFNVSKTQLICRPLPYPDHQSRFFFCGQLYGGLCTVYLVVYIGNLTIRLNCNLPDQPDIPL